MGMIRQALARASNDSNQQLTMIFIGIGMAAAALSYVYFVLVGRQHQGTLIAYLLPMVLFLAGLAFLVVARLIDDPYAALGYVALALFLLFAAVVSLVVTLLLLTL